MATTGTTYVESNLVISRVRNWFSNVPECRFRGGW